uniref:uncharacterized protein LOC104265599 n=1 Tax=Ciona intestinalis TaxID=7719 RepID=UPI0005215251|nr:uncharacterized protein LOC104265599 [Ciona intestinalis]|eukprot:XP_009858283.1 uncharacterized protein LOC104265599 [Ciona intestinalis]
MMKRMTEQVKDDVQKIMQEFGNLVHDRLNAYLRQTLGLPVCVDQNPLSPGFCTQYSNETIRWHVGNWFMGIKRSGHLDQLQSVVQEKEYDVWYEAVEKEEDE